MQNGAIFFGQGKHRKVKLTISFACQKLALSAQTVGYAAGFVNGSVFSSSELSQMIYRFVFCNAEKPCFQR